jgi:hypothetical protein
MRVQWGGLVVLALMLAPAAASADRLTDEQLKAVLERIDERFDDFKDELERRNLDDAVIRTAAGTIDVARFLDEFERDIHQAKDRYKPSYSAGPEVLAVLRRGSDIERRYQQGGRGASEWDALSEQLGLLAQAYGLEWPLTTMEVQGGRLNDQEAAEAAEQIARAAGRLKGEADKAAKRQGTRDEAGRQELERTISALEQSAKEVKSRVGDDRPASGELSQMLDRARETSTAIATLPLSSQGKTAWSTIERHGTALSRAFGVVWTATPVARE